MAEVIAPVDLSEMNDKQLAREFKAVGKQMKSKDPDIKFAALQKLKDFRYFTIGGCLAPLIESMVPKKKLTIESEKLLGVLESFVGSPSFMVSSNASAVQQSLGAIISCSGDLNVLRVLSDLTLFSEELKAPKQKKGLPIEIPQESEIAIYLRHTSLKVLCSMCLILSAPNTFDQGLAESFASVASLVESICLVLENLRIRYSDPSTKEGMLQEGIWGLTLLLFLLRNCPSSISVLHSGDLLETLREFIMEESFSVFCLQILEIISLSNDKAFINFMDEELVARITDAVFKATEESTNRADIIANGTMGITAAIPGKGKSAKKDKGNCANDSSSQAVGKSDKADIFRQTRRQKVACIKLAAKTLTAICEKNGQALSEYQISRLVLSFSKVLSDKSIWELTQTPIAEPYDISLVDTIERICMFIGALGLVHSTQRRAACEAGCVSLLLTVLQNSMLIFNCMVAQTAGILQNFSVDEVASTLVGKKEKGSKNNLGATLKGKIPEPVRPGLGTPAEEAEKLKKVRALRRASEKALMSLLSERSLEDFAPSEPDFASSTKRWYSASVKHTIDLTLFNPVSEFNPDKCIEAIGSGVPLLFPMSQLMEVIASSDIDLGNRGLRVFSAILEGVEDPESLLNDLNLDAAAVGSLSTTVQIRAMIMIDLLDVQQDKRDLFPEGNIGSSTDFNDPKAVLENDPMDFTAFGSNDEDIMGNIVSAVDILQPSETEALYLALLILEKAIRLSNSNVNIFATKDRLGSLASLLYRCGAIGSLEEDLSGSNNSLECIISLADPRNYNWLSSEDDVPVDKVLLRPLIFDIVGLIASSEEKYRSYEGTGPVDLAPGGPLLASSSPCREAALSAAKLCGDAAVSVLLVNARYTLQQAGAQGQGSFHIVAQARSGSENSLLLAVQDGALRSLLAMIRSGALFLYAVLESVAEAGFFAKETKPNNNKYSALTGLRHFLGNIPSYAVLQDTDEATFLLLEELQSSLSVKTVWARALLFDQLFTGSTFCTTAQTVLSNPAMWPYMSICTALIGVISSPESAYSTVTSATETVMKLCRVDHIADFSQPVIADSFCAFFLGLGGATALSGSMGRFGTFRTALNTTEESIELHDLGLAFLKYLVGRGREREVYWLSKMPIVSSTPLDPKSQKAATAAKDLKAKEKEKILKDQKKGKSPVKAEEASVVEDVAWNLETDGTHPDPNHGPTRAFWKDILEGQFDELHTLSERSNLLLVALQGGLPGLVCDLVEERAGVHTADMCGVTPLMYALLLGDEESASALISAGADVDAIDAFGNPAITSACHSASPADIDAALFGPVAMAGDQQAISILGGCQMLPLLLAAGADTHVCSSSGNSPILSAMGLGSVTLSIGGYQVTVGSNSYNTGYPRSTTLSAVESLLSHGALVNACNHSGVVPLHIAAARGHRELIDLFKDHGVFANAEDSGGYMPLHYVVAACPAEAPQVFDHIMECCRFRPVQRMVFSDLRTGKSKAQKYEEDIADKMDKIFEGALGVSTVRSTRLSEQDLMERVSGDGLNLVQLCMTASTLQLDPFKDLLSGGKYDRIDLIEHLVSRSTGSLMTCTDCYGMTVMHAASLLLQGITPSRALTPQELRSKRVKTYPSVELKLLDAIRDVEGITAGECSRSVGLKGFRATLDGGPFLWTPLHGAIAGDNMDLVDTLLKEAQVDLGLYSYGHFLACTEAGPIVCDQIVAACSSSSSYSALLNNPAGPEWPARPLHLAARAGNFNAVNRLLRCSKVDPNARDEVTGMTAVHEACQRADLDILRTFGHVSDRLDLLATDFDGKTCIELAVDTKNIQILELLVKMRRNDVLEKVLRSTESPSILVQLEVENLAIARALGYSTTESGDGYVEEKTNDELIIIPLDCDGISESMKNENSENNAFSPISMAEFQTVDFSNAGLIDDCVKEETPVLDTRNTELLLISNQIIKLLIDAAGEAGIPDEFHAHHCFARGILYSEFASRNY